MFKYHYVSPHLFNKPFYHIPFPIILQFSSLKSSSIDWVFVANMKTESLILVYNFLHLLSSSCRLNFLLKRKYKTKPTFTLPSVA